MQGIMIAYVAHSRHTGPARLAAMCDSVQSHVVRPVDGRGTPAVNHTSSEARTTGL